MLGRICTEKIERRGYRVTVEPGLCGGVTATAAKGFDLRTTGALPDTEMALLELYTLIFGRDLPMHEREHVSRPCPLLDGSLDQGRLF